jgi:hypothetical protein
MAKMLKASADAEHESQGPCVALESNWVMLARLWLMV